MKTLDVAKTLHQIAEGKNLGSQAMNYDAEKHRSFAHEKCVRLAKEKGIVS